MRVPDHPFQIRRMLNSRLKKLATTSPVLAASLHAYTHRCGRATCEVVASFFNRLLSIRRI